MAVWYESVRDLLKARVGRCASFAVIKTQTELIAEMPIIKAKLDVTVVGSGFLVQINGVEAKITDDVFEIVDEEEKLLSVITRHVERLLLAAWVHVLLDELESRGIGIFDARFERTWDLVGLVGYSVGSRPEHTLRCRNRDGKFFMKMTGKDDTGEQAVSDYVYEGPENGVLTALKGLADDVGAALRRGVSALQPDGAALRPKASPSVRDTLQRVLEELARMQQELVVLERDGRRALQDDNNNK